MMLSRLRSVFALFALILPVGVFAQDPPSELEQELRFVSDNALGVVIVRPAELLRHKDIGGNPLANIAGRLGIRPGDVERLVVGVIPHGPPLYDMGIVFCVRFTDDIDQNALRRKLSPRATKLEGWPFPVYDGQESGEMTFGFPDARTVVFSSDGGTAFGALAVGVVKAWPKPKLVEMCGPRTRQQVFCAVDVDRLLHAATFMRGSFNPGVAKVSGQFVPAGLRRVRAWFDVDADTALSVRLTPDETRADGFPERVERVKVELLRRARAAVDATIHGRPQLAEPAASIKALIAGLKSVRADVDVAINLDPSLSGADAWKRFVSAAALVKHYQTGEQNELETQAGLITTLIALHTYHDVYMRLPTDIRDENGKALLSWRVAVLPFIGESDLYQLFKLDEPWDSPHNKALLRAIPQEFRTPGDPKNGQTRVQRPVVQGVQAAVRLGDVTDGTSNTVALVPAEKPVPWTQPIDHKVVLANPWKGLLADGWFGFLDGSVQKVSRDAVGDKLANLFTHNAADATVMNADETIDADDATGYLTERMGRAGLDAETTQVVLQVARNQDVRAEKVLAAARRMIATRDPIVQAMGLIAIEKGEASYDWQDLKPLVKSRFEFVRAKSMELMARTGQRGVVSALFDPNSPDHGALWQLLHDTGLGEKHASRELLPMLKHEAPEYRSAAGWIIAVFGKKPYRKHIETLLQDEDELVRQDAKQMLEAIDASGP